jgi:hypothetical protein
MTNSNQQLFAALKAQDGTSTQAINEAASAAEQRWPLLKSLSPQKWAIAPALSNEEKLKRSRLEPIEVVNRKPAASTPNINAQLANALNRMAISKPIEPVLSPTPSTAPTPVASKAPLATTPPLQTEAEIKPVAASKPAQLSDNSITATLQRIEQAHAPKEPNTSKVPGFLSRLGKR